MFWRRMVLSVAGSCMLMNERARVSLMKEQNKKAPAGFFILFDFGQYNLAK